MCETNEKVLSVNLQGDDVDQVDPSFIQCVLRKTYEKNYFLDLGTLSSYGTGGSVFTIYHSRGESSFKEEGVSSCCVYGNHTDQVVIL